MLLDTPGRSTDMASRLRTAVVRSAAAIESGRRRSIVVLLLILLFAGLLSVLHSVAKPFWFDEICTVIMCRLPGPSAIWNALDHAADGQPPGYYLTLRVARQLIPEDHLGYRAPSILGLLITVLCIYFILSRRVNYLAALVGATFVLSTELSTYASEARPYALMVACISAAILAWQRIDDSKLNALFLALALGAAVSLHYYSIFVLPAFVLAEATVWLLRRRFRMWVWAALAAGAIPWLFIARFLLRMRDYNGRNFWSKPHFGELFIHYNTLFNVGGAWGLTFLAGISIIFAYWGLRKWSLRKTVVSATEERSRVPAEECVLILVLMWLPLIEITAAKLGHGGMTTRYMMPTILGGALAVGYLAGKLPGLLNGLLLILLLMNFAVGSTFDVANVLRGSLFQARAAAAGEVRAIAEQDPKRALPIVISSGLQYLPMVYYTPGDLKNRLYAVTDPQAALIYRGTDSMDLNLLVLRQYFPLQVEDYAGFASRHKEFLLVSNGEEFDWLPALLSQAGGTLRVLSEEGNTRVYDVSLKP
jgi:hypothetical protein